ncbi:hypothetical protein OH738_25750 [Streptomyces hirsutus]|uniref:Type I restriction modification DNA specificity domain-containing protein n=1 Tax=Streptomyces hirsutus TaxID=35620 RepID=A0ABZ1GKT0_9ACTN|nr:hypothetical protein [Streptomyces hirsutus]WSD06766.1 hypothetical protein OIE73_13940 [Streptomyces hirsutus]WTD19826.1 hypothetical protein OH738_25750 [Streptomyces hirsutus]
MIVYLSGPHDEDAAIESIFFAVLGYRLDVGSGGRTIRSMAQGTSESMVKISAGAVRDLRIPLPDLKDQEHLLSALDSVSSQLTKESAELVKLRRLKQGIVGDLLSGRGEMSTAAA